MSWLHDYAMGNIGNEYRRPPKLRTQRLWRAVKAIGRAVTLIASWLIVMATAAVAVFLAMTPAIVQIVPTPARTDTSAAPPPAPVNYQGDTFTARKDRP